MRCDQIQEELAEIRAGGAPPGERDLRDYLESTVGPTLTELAFAGLNEKFWGRRLEDMPATWGKLRRLERVAERGEYRLPSTAPHSYPAGGFNPLFDGVLEGVDVRYGVTAERIERNGSTSTVSSPRTRAATVRAINARWKFRPSARPRRHRPPDQQEHWWALLVSNQ